MDLYEILLQRLVLLTDEYLQLKERVKELENEAKIRNSTAPRIVKMRVRGLRSGTEVDANQQRRPGNNMVAGITFLANY